MKGYSYIVARDYGFAPNPFYGMCTLATCKPLIRKHSEVGDYVIGLTPRDRGRGNRLAYHNENNEWMQEDSHHSNEDGSINEYNLNRDTGTTDRVLISNDFYYFGKNCLELPPELVKKITIGVGQKPLTSDVVNEVLAFVTSKVDKKGYLGEPHSFQNFQRYDGVK